MKNKYLHTNILFLFIVIVVTTMNVRAEVTPTFPTCLNPQGELKVTHINGTHGVPGDTTTYTGHDTVYHLTENTLTQCLCPTTGNGIQTNWWNVKGMNQGTVDSYKLKGWIFIPDGSAWGLESDPYLAQNINYSCVGGKGGGNTNSSSSSSNSNGSSSNQGAETQNTSISGQILSLASTGNVITLYLSFIIGFSFLISGIYIRRVHPGNDA